MSAHEGSNTLKIENTDKRDTLVALEKKYQKQWTDKKLFEVNAPTIEDEPPSSISSSELRKKHPKYFANFAFPYMNGSLHAGHAFTASKIEFDIGFRRMQGKRSLWPLGFHCTGMPIKACADKLADEISLFGKNFDGYKPESEKENEEKVPKGEAPAPTPETTKTDLTKHTTSKSKAKAKSGGMKYQFLIMEAQGVPREEIHKFQDAQYWLQYYPPLCKQDLTSMGARIDWRRSFVTTDANPYYDKFVRWQMRKLKELGKIKFGKRYTVYSPKDGQACLDHDRKSGEGVAVQEYTAIKLKVKEWGSENAKKVVDGKIPDSASVYFVPATLRPETMYGQTCCFVGPSITYGIFKVTDNEYFVISDRAARNMSFQNIFPQWGVVSKVAGVQGADLVGTLVHAPLSVHKEIRILPMDTVKDDKGTGVVTSVPSDSPDDYATVINLAKKAEFYQIKKEWAELEIIPIIETPSYGNLTAPTLVKQLKINGPSDKKLVEAKDLAYKEGFYQGKMVFGEFAGKPVSEAKPLVRQQLIDSGDAFNYAEPDGLVISRSDDVCVAAHLDQWFLNYGTSENGGDGQWCQAVLDHIGSDNINLFSSETKNQFEQVLNWLSQWACARSFGLGTKLPWDEQFLVESLSDSTIYPSYYTIAHYLHSDIFGKTPGKAKITPEQMTDDVWDYIYSRSDSVKSDIPQNTLDAMKREFQYFYPQDVRGSGKDLIQNHLTFFLYVHVALFPQEYWPKGIRANGHLMLNGEKMAKSTGNFLTLAGAVNKFGADATRITLADAGDGIDDANFEEAGANAAILRLHTLKEWCEEVLNDAQIYDNAADLAKARDAKTVKNTDVIQRTGDKNFWDSVFENELNALVKETYDAYELTYFKLGLKTGFYDFLLARDRYRAATAGAGLGMHHDLVKRYTELQALMLTPLAPHFAEHIWLDLLKKSDTIQNAHWPQVPAAQPALTAASEYVKSTTSNITSAEGLQTKKLAKGKNVDFDPNKNKKVTIYVASVFPAWQDPIVEAARAAFDGVSLDMKKVSSKIPKADTKKAMPLVQEFKRRLDAKEPSEQVFERKLPFDEVEVLKNMASYLRAVVKKCVEVEIVRTDEISGDLPQAAESAVPGKPAFVFTNV